MDKKEYKWYVYQLIDPRNNEVFYIGKGTQDRIHEHEKEALKGVCSYKCHKINKIRNSGLNIIKKKIAYFCDEEYAYQIEFDLISSTPNLTNVVGRMEKTPAQYQLEMPLPIPRPLLEIATENYQAIQKYMGEFAFWYKNSKHGTLKASISDVDGTYGKVMKACINSLYNTMFPSVLTNIKKSPKIEQLLKQELNAYGVQYGC
jgi:hypothetical protein